MVALLAVLISGFAGHSLYRTRQLSQDVRRSLRAALEGGRHFHEDVYQANLHVRTEKDVQVVQKFENAIRIQAHAVGLDLDDQQAALDQDDRTFLAKTARAKTEGNGRESELLKAKALINEVRSELDLPPLPGQTPEAATVSRNLD